MAGFESFSRKTERSEQPKTAAQEEQEAADTLEELLDDPENGFLTEVEANREKIENSSSVQEALAFAVSQIEARLLRTTNFQVLNNIDSLPPLLEVSLLHLKHNIDTVIRHQKEIGRGGDGYVVVDKNEIRSLPPEICYKFALAETTPRGRNSVRVEAELQSMFYESSGKNPDSKIGVPKPFYVLEIANKKVIAMEKLGARNLDDILRGKGSLPKGFDVDVFCDEIESALKHFHSQGLYHRDMHFGNIMVVQKPEVGPDEKWGYIIDFGLSGKSDDEKFAYEKDVADNHFTYSNDYGILGVVRKQLKELQHRES